MGLWSTGSRDGLVNRSVVECHIILTLFTVTSYTAWQLTYRHTTSVNSTQYTVGLASINIWDQHLIAITLRRLAGRFTNLGLQPMPCYAAVLANYWLSLPHTHTPGGGDGVGLGVGSWSNSSSSSMLAGRSGKTRWDGSLVHWVWLLW